MKKNLLTLLFLVVLCIGFSGTIYAASPPSVTPTGTLSYYTTTQGTFSTTQYFSVSGSNLIGDITITPPTGVEISTDAITFTNSLLLTQSGGNVNPTNIYVRIASTAPAGIISGNINMTSSGAGTSTMSVTGMVSTGSPLVSVVDGGNPLSPFSTVQGSVSAPQFISAAGSDLTTDITLTAPAGIELSSDGSTYSNPLTLTESGGNVTVTTIFVRISNTASTGTISGTISLNSAGATTASMSVSGTVHSPVITPSASFTAFNTPQGIASAYQNFSVNGTDLLGDITATAPTGMEVSQDGITFTPSIILTQSGGVVSSGTLYIRVAASALQGTISATLDFSSSGATTASLPVSGSVGAPVPTIMVLGGGSLTNFTTTQGVASAAQQFDVSGADLTTDIMISGPTGLEYSSDGGATYGPSVTLFESGGNVSQTPIFVRIYNSAPVGPINGFIDMTSSGASTASVSVTGTVNAPTPVISVTGSLTSFTTTQGTYSSYQTFDVGGTDLIDDIAITPPSDVEVSLDGISFSPTLTLTNSGGTITPVLIYIRIAATALSGTISNTVNMSSNGATTSSLNILGTVNPPASPLISTTGTFSPFNTTSGTASARQSVDVTGTNLIDDITINAPTGMEVSSDGISYLSPGIVLTNSGGNVATITVYLRISSTASGVISGTLDLTSNSASTVSLSVSGNVGPLPTINVVGSFAPFTTTQGTASADQLITVSGTDLLGNIVINNLPTGIEASSDGGATYNTSLTLSMVGGIVNSTAINVRISASAIAGTITGNVDVGSFNATTSSVPVSGTVNPPGPNFSIVPTSLIPFTTVSGVASTAQTFTISGSNLIAPVNGSFVSGLEYSIDGGNTYSNAVPKFTPIAGNINTSFLVRVSASAPAGDYINFLIFSSSSASNQTINVHTTITGLSLTTASLSPFTSTAGNASSSQVYYVNGAGLSANVLVTPPVGYEVAIDTNGTVYQPTVSLTLLSGGRLINKSVHIRLASTAFGGSHIGTIVHSTPGTTSQLLPVSGYVIINCGSIANNFAGNDTTFCGTTIQLTGASITPGFPYQWRIIGGTAVKIAPDTNARKPFIVFPDATTSVTQQIELSVDPGCPLNRDTIVITKTISGLPSANAGVDFQTAQNNNISIGNSGSGAITWSTSGTGSFNSTTTALTNYTPSAQDLSDGQVELVINALGTGSCSAYKAEDTVYVTLASSTFNITGNLTNTASSTSYRILLAHQMNDFWNVVKDSIFNTTTYHFQGLSNGNYRVEAITNDKINIPTYFGNTTNWENSTVLNIAGSNLTGKDIAMNSYALHPDTVAKYLSGQGKCVGRILLDLLNRITNLRIATDASDLKPVQGATVNIYNSSGNTKLTSTTTDANGFYSVSGLTAQSYQIEVQYPGTVLDGTTASSSSQLQPLASDGSATTPVLKDVEVVKITQSAQNKIGGGTVTTSIFQPLETEKILEMILYPNPAKTKATVKITLPDSWIGITRVIVFDAQGKPVLTDDYTGNADALLLKTDSLISGFYMVSIQNSGRIQLKQMIVE